MADAAPLTLSVTDGTGAPYWYVPSFQRFSRLRRIDRFDRVDGPYCRLAGDSGAAKRLLVLAVRREVLRMKSESDDDSTGTDVQETRIEALRRLRSTPPALLTQERVCAINAALDPGPTGGHLQRPGEPRPKHRGASGKPYVAPPRASQLTERLAGAVDFATSGQPDVLHPVERAIIAAFMVRHDRPFRHANELTARCVLVEALRSYGYVSASLLAPAGQPVDTDEERRAFVDALSNRNLSPYLDDQVDRLWSSFQQLAEDHDRHQQHADRISALTRNARFNDRQLALLYVGLDGGDSAFSIRDHAANHGVAYATARADILELVRHELLVASRAGKRKVDYRYAPFLRTRLSAV